VVLDDERAAFRTAIEEMVVMLENGEWAEHVAETIAGGDELASRLEAAITELHNDIGEDRSARAASPQATATQPEQTERALTVTPAMVKAAMPWLANLHHMRKTDKASNVEEAIKAALTAAQPASGADHAD
jgi:hypothetical protein